MKNSILALILYVVVFLYNAIGTVGKKFENGIWFLNWGDLGRTEGKAGFGCVLFQD